MTSRIPLIATPSQTLSITLGGQRCEIEVTQKFAGGVFLSLTVNGVNAVNSALCRDRVSIIRQSYRAFVGRLVFIDTQGFSDPDYSGFAERYKLAYLP
jgi:hypothetical protein